jgi:hypothetical protein
VILAEGVVGEKLRFTKDFGHLSRNLFYDEFRFISFGYGFPDVPGSPPLKHRRPALDE